MSLAIALNIRLYFFLVWSHKNNGNRQPINGNKIHCSGSFFYILSIFDDKMHWKLESNKKPFFFLQYFEQNERWTAFFFNVKLSLFRTVASIIADTLKLNYWNGDDNLDNNMLLNIVQHVKNINSKRMSISSPLFLLNIWKGATEFCWIFIVCIKIKTFAHCSSSKWKWKKMLLNSKKSMCIR